MATFVDDGPSFSEVLRGIRHERDSERSREAGLQAEVAPSSMLEWALRVPERGQKLNMELFPFQAPYPASTAGPGLPGLYSDEVAAARDVVIQKSSQIGVTSCLWRWAFRRADLFGDTIIYVFPTDTHVTQFGVERIDPSIEDSEYLQTRIPPGFINNQHQKRIGAGWCYLRGSTQKRVGKRQAGAQSTAAQALVFDEYDELDTRGLDQYERRVSGAAGEGKLQRIRRVGVPSMDGFGIAAQYARSDQRTWHVACRGCGCEQEVEFANVRWVNERGERTLRAGNDEPGELATAWRACNECEAELDVSNGRWLALNPGSKVVGFYAPRLIVPGTDLLEMVKNSRKTMPYEVESFHNHDLGLPYTPMESGLTRGIVEAACSMGEELRESYRGPLTVIGGLDVAGERNMHLRLSLVDEDGRRLPLYVSEVEDFDEIDSLMIAFNVRLLAVDSMPERRGARALAARFPGRVVLAMYVESADAEPILWNPRKNLVNVHRTEAIDAMMDAVRSGRHVLPSHPPPKYVEQMIALKRRLVERASGQPRRVYVTVGNDGDDFAHAETFNVVAQDVLRMMMQAEADMPQETQPTPEEMGYEPVTLDTGFDGRF